MDNLFEFAATLNRVQAEGYRQVREMARNEALEEAAKVCEGADSWDKYAEHYPSPHSIASAIRALKAQDHPLATGDLAEQRRINDEAGR